MQIAKEIAGFSGPQADDLRKAIGKKDRQKMAGMRDAFFEGARATGTPEKVIEELWAVNEAAADYSFNRSHAACYALISYRTAWLKANFPAEYMAALISSVMSTKDKVPYFVSRCEEMGIEVLPPDVNESAHGFAVIGGNIRFGLEAVKGVGSSAVDAIVAAREADGPFKSIWDFCERVDCRAVNKKTVECLVKSGSLDSLEGTRTGMVEIMAQAQAAGVKTQQDAQLGQGSIFDEPSSSGGDSPFAKQHPTVPSLPDDRKQLNEWEKETLGLFLSSHPLKEVRPALRRKVECSIKELADKKDDEWVTVGGMVAECKKIRTKKGDPMAFITLDDLEAQVEVLIFNSAYASNSDKLDMGKVLLIRGRVDHPERGTTKLIAQDVELFEPTEEEVEEARKLGEVAPIARRIVLQVDGAVDAGFIDDLKHVVHGAKGDHELWLKVGERTLVLGEEFRVSPNCRHELAELSGVLSLAA